MPTNSRELLALGIFGRASLGDRIEILLKCGRDFSPRASFSRVAVSAAVLLLFMIASSLAPRWIAFAQPPGRASGNPRSFEVVAVKPSRDASTGSDVDSDGSIFTARNVSLQRLIALAYGIGEYRVEGPGWLGSERFNIDAKFPAGELTDTAFRAMMQNMLADRFKLAFHRVTRTMSVYGLVVAKGGIKIGPVQEGVTDSSSHNNRYSGTSVKMVRFAEFLSRRADLPVVDMTGLTDFYTFDFEWTPEPTDERKDAPSAPGANPAWAAVREAVETKLGLRLENRKAPVEVLVIDHVERPDAN